jgi:hypothetical protein
MVMLWKEHLEYVVQFAVSGTNFFRCRLMLQLIAQVCWTTFLIVTTRLHLPGKWLLPNTQFYSYVYLAANAQCRLCGHRSQQRTAILSGVARR